MKHHLFALLLAGSMLETAPVFAQTVTGEKMQNYNDVFGVQIDQRSYPYDVIQIEGKSVVNLLKPGDERVFIGIGELRRTMDLILDPIGIAKVHEAVRSGGLKCVVNRIVANLGVANRPCPLQGRRTIPLQSGANSPCTSVVKGTGGQLIDP